MNSFISERLIISFLLRAASYYPIHMNNSVSKVQRVVVVVVAAVDFFFTKLHKVLLHSFTYDACNMNKNTLVSSIEQQEKFRTNTKPIVNHHRAFTYTRAIEKKRHLLLLLLLPLRCVIFFSLLRTVVRWFFCFCSFH